MKPNQKNRYNGRYNNRNTRSMILRNTVMESSGPMGKIHGTAMQLSEKYQAYAKDFLIQNDVVMVQTCMQYADHYIRIQNIAITNEQSLRPQNNAEQRQQNFADKQIVSEPILEENKDNKNDVELYSEKETLIVETINNSENMEIVKVDVPEKKEKSIKKQVIRKAVKKKDTKKKDNLEIDENPEMRAEDVLGCDLSVPIAVMQEKNETPIKAKRISSRHRLKQAVS